MLRDLLTVAMPILAAGVVAVLILLWMDRRREDRDTTPVESLDVLLDRGDADDTSEAELNGWATVLHDLRVAPSPLLHRRMAIEEHDPLDWEQRRRVFGVRIREQRRRVRLTTDMTQEFDAFVELETGKRPHGKGPAEVDIRYTRTEVSAQQLALDLGVLR